jgi:hypothetical protein
MLLYVTRVLVIGIWPLNVISLQFSGDISVLNRFVVSVVCSCVITQFIVLFWWSKMCLSVVHSIFVVRHHFVRRSFVLCREDFQEAFPNETVPNKTTVHRVTWKFRETDDVYNRKHIHCPTVLSDRTLEAMREKGGHFQQFLLTVAIVLSCMWLHGP